MIAHRASTIVSLAARQAGEGNKNKASFERRAHRITILLASKVIKILCIPMLNRPRVLIACLDWGLGHAARSLPVADALEAAGAEPVLASAGAAADFLKAERPGLELLPLPPYNIRYKHQSMVANMAWQAPKLAAAAWREHRILQQYIDQYHLRGVISDNRFGCFSRKVPCAFLTHQLRPRIQSRFLRPLGHRLNQLFIQRFQECWVPDLPGADNLSGHLSHPPLGNSSPTYYIGWLSRFTNLSRGSSLKQDLDSLTVLSGPEPQRTFLEQQILDQLPKIPGHHLLVRGVPQEAPERKAGNIRILNYLTGPALWRVLQRATVVVGRPGYSSLMDWGLAEKKALCIPTPGQTEQEYLAQRLYAEGRIAVQQQNDIRLENGLQAAMQCKGLEAPALAGSLAQCIQRFLASLPLA